MVKVLLCSLLAQGWRGVTNLGGNQLIVVCVYARRHRVAAVASPPLRHCRRVAAIAILVAITLVVVVATAVAAVAAASWLAAGARMGGSEINDGGCGCGCSMRRIACTTMWDNAARPTIEGCLGSNSLLPRVPFFELLLWSGSGGGKAWQMTHTSAKRIRQTQRLRGSRQTRRGAPLRGRHAMTTSWRAPTTDRKGTTTAVHWINELDERWNDEM